MIWRRLRSEHGTVSIVQAALITPLLALLLGMVLHLGLFMLSRQAATSAVQRGVTVAASRDGTDGQGRQATIDIISQHSPLVIQGVSVTSSGNPPQVTVTANVRAPGLVPGLPRTLTVSQSAVREEWIDP